MKKLTKNIILIFNIIAIMALAGSYLSQYIPPDKWWAPSLLGLGYPYILAVNLLFILIWLMIKPVNTLFSVLAIIAGWGVLSRFIQLSGKESDTRGIRVVSYNVKTFTGTGSNPSRDLAEVIKGFLKENEPD
ncbi:MAG TPA: hypothetical protein PKM75_06405, partial [Prolixibacteraceae bacterium]|nr:hypothetical protein [Prolixibacteraceae bacterium]